VPLAAEAWILEQGLKMDEAGDNHLLELREAVPQ
jgi:hypothetical protein